MPYKEQITMPDLEISLCWFEGLQVNAASFQENMLVLHCNDGAKIGIPLGVGAYVQSQKGKFEIAKAQEQDSSSHPHPKPSALCQGSLDPDGV